ncbi:MAG: hypothetical protein PHQ12_14845 [Chthoniobacteraceae bacterium]|nr:hypothetical protein [Chthoniobacteraceae bacterium]
MRSPLLCLLALLPALCGSAFSQTKPVTRSEALAIAEHYRLFEWTPARKNIFHGRDPDGILVNTPDAGYNAPGHRPGWWEAGKVNVGMPYKWGGFNSLEGFKEGLEKGFYAGDVYTREKRRLLDAAVSKYTIGIDCSGLISRCWKLDRSFSTRKLPALCVPLASYADLKPGDVLNSNNNHVVLFCQFTDATQQRLLAYEAGSPPSWKVQLDDIPVAMLQEQGYQPFRYRKMKD